MESRLEKLEEKIGNVRTDQSAIKQSLSMMSKTLDTLADVRAETLHIIKQQEQDGKARDEAFKRLRVAESTLAACSEKHVVCDRRIGSLEKNQRWGVVVIFSSIVGYIFKKLFL